MKRRFMQFEWRMTPTQQQRCRTTSYCLLFLRAMALPNFTIRVECMYMWTYKRAQDEGSTTIALYSSSSYVSIQLFIYHHPVAVVHLHLDPYPIQAESSKQIHFKFYYVFTTTPVNWTCMEEFGQAKNWQ